MGRKAAAGIDQVDAGQVVFGGDLLGAQVFLDGNGVIGAALDGGVVDDDGAGLAGDPADAGDDAGTRRPVVVQFVAGEQPNLEERRPGIEQPFQTVPWQQLAPGGMAVAGPFVAAEREFGGEFTQLCRQRAVVLAVGFEAGRPGVDLAAQYGHPDIVRSRRERSKWRRFKSCMREHDAVGPR